MSLLDAIKGSPNGALPLPWLATAGQPTAEQFAAARDAGVKVVIDLRDPMEPRPFDEAATLTALGISYINVPVVSGALSDQVMEKVLAAVRAHANEPTILHCASANRVGGALIPYFILDQGMDEQAAVDAAMAVGLRSAELMEWGLDYARRQG
ncbi:MAG: sulfur transferase domain-containing protein [Gemmatimonadales bacterium]|jgi:protein tyrosine phosphatase (PTP) superfamily phosphohydrolase (DUF442 family)|nr:sulfur transferase domain-containing protein [Gemmatimonadales bacterium]HQW66743.1 sulfur transferase domain-containing protein [Gemmatimonadales bacterium]